MTSEGELHWAGILVSRLLRIIVCMTLIILTVLMAQIYTKSTENRTSKAVVERVSADDRLAQKEVKKTSPQLREASSSAVDVPFDPEPTEVVPLSDTGTNDIGGNGINNDQDDNQDVVESYNIPSEEPLSFGDSGEEENSNSTTVQPQIDDTAKLDESIGDLTTAAPVTTEREDPSQLETLSRAAIPQTPSQKPNDYAEQFLSRLQPQLSSPSLVTTNLDFYAIQPRLKPALLDEDRASVSEIMDESEGAKKVSDAVAVDKAYFFQSTHRALRGNNFRREANSVIVVEHTGEEQQALRFPYKVMPHNWITSAPEPIYPEKCAAMARQKEIITIRFRVDGRGKAPKPIVTSVSNPCFSDAARSMVRNMNFRVRAAPGYAYGGSEFLTSVIFEKPLSPISRKAALDQ